MDSVSKTLYIPLYGKAYVSKKGLFFRDTKAEAIWEKEGFPLRGKAKSKWLAYNMGMRAAVFDRWVTEKLAEDPGATVLHIGCGLDNRAGRVGCGSGLWYDIDFPEVIEERKRYFAETENYRMVGADVRQPDWLEQIGKTGSAVVMMEGVSMYLQLTELQALMEQLRRHFGRISLLMDTYTVFAAKVTRYKNPINTVGVTQVYGLDDPGILKGMRVVREWELTPQWCIGQLPLREQGFFRKMFAGKMARKIYRLYELEA